jgi:hypothetical protein
VLFYVFFVCKYVLYYCHRVLTQLQLTNISYHIIISYQSVHARGEIDPECPYQQQIRTARHMKINIREHSAVENSDL